MRWSVERLGASWELGQVALRAHRTSDSDGAPWTRAWLDLEASSSADTAHVHSMTQGVRLVTQWAFAALGLAVISWRGPTVPILRAIVHDAGFRVHPMPERKAWDGEDGPEDAWFADLLPNDATPTGVRPLTAREHEVLNLMARGYSNQRIAQSLGISENTVKNHVRAILDALGTSSRTAAVVAALNTGLVGLSGTS